jgi:hypothetical protein
MTPNYVVKIPCQGSIDNRYDDTLQKGEHLIWLGTDSGGSLYQRSTGEKVFVSKSDDDHCIKPL